jgi:hypothetical protein
VVALNWSKISYMQKIKIFLFLLTAVLIFNGCTTKTSNPLPGTANSTPGPQKFADSRFASSAVQIYPGPLSGPAIQAVTGFNIETKALADGSVQVNLTSTNPEYQNQEVVVKSGYTLYFIEQSGGDDSSGDNADQNLRDDTTVLVDPQGFIAQ